MKKLLFMFVLSICAVVWRSDAILQGLGVTSTAAAASIPPGTATTTSAAQSGTGPNQPMSLDDFARLSHTDPAAYQKFIASRTQSERTAADKLMNFFTNGKYE